MSNIPVLLDTFLKDKEILSSEGPFASDLKRSSPSLQDTTDQILAQRQCSNTSTESVSTSTAQKRNNGWSAMLSGKNCPQHEPRHVGSNDRPLETSAILEKSLLQTCPKLRKLSFSSSKYQNDSAVSTTANALQQSMQHKIVFTSTGAIIVQNTKNQQPHVKVIDNLHKDSVLQGVLTSGGYLLLTQTQMINPCQQPTCMPKDVYQQQHVPQKAIAVVSPLNQQVVDSVTISKDSTKVEESHQTLFILQENDHQSCIPPAFQSTDNESSVKALHVDTVQTKHMTSESVQTCGFSQSVKSNKLTGQSESLSSVPLNSVRMKEVQQYPTDDNSSIKFPSEDAAVMERNCRRDKLSTLPVNEWSLQRLETLVNELEQIQKKQQKDVPFNDLSKEILKSYWNGDYRKLCSAVKSDMYINIMKEVKLHCGKRNSSIILQDFSRDRLNEIASTVHILEHGTEPPNTVFRSSWLNLSLTLCDKGHDSTPTLMTLHSQPQISDKKAPVKEMENAPGSTNKNILTSNKELNGGEIQRKPSSLKQLQNPSVKSDIVVRKEPGVVDVGKTCSVKETGREIMTEKEVLMKRAQSDKQDTKDENEASSSLVSLRTQSQDVSDSCLNNKAPINDLTPVLDKIGFVDNTKKDDAHFLTDPKGRVTAELLDKDKNRTATKLKSDKMSSQIKIYRQLEDYCCPRKWFQHLGYRNKGLCACEKKAELSQHADASGKGSKKVKENEHKYSFHQDCKLIDCGVCVLRGKRQGKKRHRRMTKKNDDYDASVDDIKIADVFTNYEDVLKMANAISEQLKERDATTCGEHCRDHHKEIRKPKSKIQDTKLQLALFGTSHLRKKKQILGFMSSDMLPPETINVRLNSGCSEYPTNIKSHTSKQQVWNSWKESYVPLKTSTNRRSKKKKCKKTSKSKNDAEENSGIKTTAFDLLSPLLSHEDTQTHHSEAKHKNSSSLAPTDKRKHGDADKSKKKSMKTIGFVRRDQLKNLERRNFLTFNRNKRWDCAHHVTKLKKSSFESGQVINTSNNESNTESALHFGVLPESFSISDGGLSIETNQCAVADSGSTVKTVLQSKRIRGNSVNAWCVSPRKKLCLPSQPTQLNTSEPTTFQEFKKKYEKKQRIPI